MLPLHINVATYPYSEVIDDELFRSIIVAVVKAEADRIAADRVSALEGYSSNPLAIAVLDPTAGSQIESAETLMFTATIGDFKEPSSQQMLLLQAVAIACRARDLATKASEINSSSRLSLPFGSILLQPTSTGRHGIFSGVSGQSSEINRRVSARMEYQLASTIQTWIGYRAYTQPDEVWFGGSPDPRFQRALGKPADLILVDSAGNEEIRPR